MDLKDRIVRDLADAHAHTDALLAPVDDTRLHAQHDPIMSPLVWDYGHVAVYQELWLVQQLSGAAAADEARMHHYDAFENPRRVRASLPLMRRDQVSLYRDTVDAKSLALLEEADVDGNPDALLRHGYVYDMIVQHEHQHSETLLQTLQLMEGGYSVTLPALPSGRDVVLDTVTIPTGRYPIGSDDHAPYDNEHLQVWVDLDGFSIDRFPVTCGQYAEFVEDGGYSRAELWSPAGWEWLHSEAAAGVIAPKHWQRRDGAWWTQRFGHDLLVDMRTPVMHVCWHETQAYCRWAGRRLPSEAEWEVAATWDPVAQRKRRFPWGDDAPTADHANLDQRLFGAAPAGAYPRGASAFGCEQMVGDVWEWTSSDFTPYPGFRAFPYREYSDVFFGPDYKVLRGASWAARASVSRATFRNWDLPIRRQIFAGFRCADPGGR